MKHRPLLVNRVKDRFSSALLLLRKDFILGGAEATIEWCEDASHSYRCCNHAKREGKGGFYV